jgi:hypothetical protein
VDAAADLRVEIDGTVDALLVTFRATLAADVELAHVPRADESSSWSASVWVLPEPLAVHAGGSISMQYRRRVPGMPEGVSCVVG